MKTRVVIVTSPLQIVNARSSLDYLDNKFQSNEKKNDIIVIAHYLSGNNKTIVNTIETLAKELNFSNTYNVSHLIKREESTHQPIRIINKIVGIKKYILDRNNREIEKKKKLNSFFKKEKIMPSEVLVRKRYNEDEKIILNILNNNTDIFFIEDGTADYMKLYYEQTRIKNIIKKIFLYFIGFFISFIFENKKSFKEIYLQKKIKEKMYFTNFLKSKSVNIDIFFKKNMQQLSLNHNSKNEDIKVIIIGTLFESKENFNISNEIKIYNELVNFIEKKFKIANKNIFYKPHPRLDVKNYTEKIKKLKCSCLNLESDILAEVYMSRKNIKAVFSVGSTSLLYAKKIFALESYVLDLRKYSDPSKNKPLRYSTYKLHKQLGITGIKI